MNLPVESFDDVSGWNHGSDVHGAERPPSQSMSASARHQIAPLSSQISITADVPASLRNSVVPSRRSQLDVRSSSASAVTSSIAPPSSSAGAPSSLGTASPRHTGPTSGQQSPKPSHSTSHQQPAAAWALHAPSH